MTANVRKRQASTTTMTCLYSFLLLDLFPKLSYLIPQLIVLRAEPINGGLQLLALLSDGHNLGVHRCDVCKSFRKSFLRLREPTIQKIAAVNNGIM